MWVYHEAKFCLKIQKNWRIRQYKDKKEQIYAQTVAFCQNPTLEYDANDAGMQTCLLGITATIHTIVHEVINDIEDFFSMKKTTPHLRGKRKCWQVKNQYTSRGDS